MQVVGWDGDKRYLVSLNGPLEEARKAERPLARVLDMNAKKFTLAWNFHSVANQEDWLALEMPEAEFKALLAQVEDREATVAEGRRLHNAGQE